MNALERALAKRDPSAEAVRIFHGPGEGTGPLRDVALDRFGRHVWITRWTETRSPEAEATLKAFLEAHFESSVELVRPSKGLPEEPRAFHGTPPLEPFVVSEGGAKFWIRLHGARHPGLFLDHQPLRSWLRESMRGLRVLNTFAYTGSLSIASGLGGASRVVSLDLSNPVTQWARENGSLNALPADRVDFLAGDVFEWLPRMARRGDRFDCVILDPPSFSRGKKGTFSTAKDLQKLHRVALDVLDPNGGLLVTSINSANVTAKQYESEVRKACDEAGFRWVDTVREISLPDTFPVPNARDAYLKGWIARLVPR